MLADFEELVCIPTNNTALQTAPAPFHNTRNNHWLGHAQLLKQQLAGQGRILVKKVADKSADGAGIGCGPERKQKERDIKRCMRQTVGC